MSMAKAFAEIKALEDLFRHLPYTSEVTETWKRNVVTHGVSGKQTHDAHLVALMQVHSVADILTFNTRHFERFPGVGVLNPALVST